jgi:putative heme transporter
MIATIGSNEPRAKVPPEAGQTGRAAAPRRPTRRDVLRRALLLIAILAFVFVVVLPQVVDYGAVRAALALLTPGQLALLAAATGLAYLANAGPSRMLVGGLSWPRAVASDLAARAVVSVIPGPTDIATRFTLYRQWSIPADVATAGIVLLAFVETLSPFVLPLVSAIGLFVTGEGGQPRVTALAVLGLLVLVIAAIVLVSIVRSESLATRLGRWLQRAADRVWGWLKRTPPTGIVDGVVDLRVRGKDTLSRRGVAGFLASVAARLAWFLVFEIALWTVGIGPDQLPPATVLTAMAMVALVSLIPITPGAVGVTEMAYIGILSSVAGADLTEQITAAVALLRIAQWLAPIPIGWGLLIVITGRRWRDVASEVPEHSAAAPTPIPTTAHGDLHPTARS